MGGVTYIYIYIYIYIYRSEGFPGTGYFIPGHVGGWGWTGLGRPSAAAVAALERSEISRNKLLDGTRHGVLVWNKISLEMAWEGSN